MAGENKPTQKAEPVDRDTAQRFLSLLAPDGRLTFQTFSDAQPKSGKHNRVVHGTLDERFGELCELNTLGAGVFVMVNAGDMRGRSASNVTSVRALFVDLDGAPLDPVLASGVTPHMVVESSPRRWHAYWLVNDCPPEQFKPLQQALATKFVGDHKVCDVPRVMRVPGFIHRKAQPVRSRLHSIEPDLRHYSAGDLARRLGLNVATHPTEEKPAVYPTEEATLQNSSSVLFCSSSVGVSGAHASSVGWPFPTADFPRDTHPRDGATRNQCVFELARHLKTLRPEVEAQAWRPIVQEWHRKFSPVVSTQDFRVTWDAFVRGFGKIKELRGAKLGEALARVRDDLPSGIQAIGYSDRGNHLARVCVAFQEHWGDQPFYLSARVAGGILDMHFTEANALLDVLVHDGVLAVIVPATSHRARRFRYVWPELHAGTAPVPDQTPVRTDAARGVVAPAAASEALNDDGSTKHAARPFAIPAGIATPPTRTHAATATASGHRAKAGLPIGNTPITVTQP